MASSGSQTAKLNDFELEYRLAPNMVVFSHGFGVRRDSRGMFTDLVRSLPDGFGYVLFDYDDVVGEGTLRATYATAQVDRLKQVMAWAKAQPGVERIGLVAHSRGCIIAALASITSLSAVILLAPPLVDGHARRYFTTKPGTVRKGDDWYVPRSDGTTTIISEGVFQEFEDVQREEVVLSYVAKQPACLIVAGADKILDDQDYASFEHNPNVSLAAIPGASHDFDGASRQELIRLVNNYLQKSF